MHESCVVPPFQVQIPAVVDFYPRFQLERVAFLSCKLFEPPSPCMPSAEARALLIASHDPPFVRMNAACAPMLMCARSLLRSFMLRFIDQHASGYRYLLIGSALVAILMCRCDRWLLSYALNDAKTNVR